MGHDATIMSKLPMKGKNVQNVVKPPMETQIQPKCRNYMTTIETFCTSRHERDQDVMQQSREGRCYEMRHQVTKLL